MAKKRGKKRIPSHRAIRPKRPGRRQMLALIEESQHMQRRMKNVPGMFSPDYSKVKQMLNLE